MVWQDGQQLQNGKYIILGEPLGRGGFGITYKALHVPLNEEVVIKTPDKYLKTDPEYSKYIERFLSEGQKLAKLSRNAHPNIVRVRDLFQEGDVHCLVMDFVQGENLFQVVKRRGRLTEADAISCFQQIGDALATMHEAGLVHRDAHPGNIILRDDGRPILIDFGIAEELVPATMSSTENAGNLGFAPYEQFIHSSREPNVDIYCLAATFYYAVTGQCPTPSLDRKLNNIALIPPRQLVPSIRQGLNKAILRGMALEAKDRLQSMRQWLEELVVIPSQEHMVWQDGQTLQNGKYLIFGEPLGRGGFGTTYKALHVSLNEEVVIKIPDKYLKTNPEYRKYIERFVKEGQRLAKLSQKAHPNIVRVRDLVEEGEVYFLVMDFVPGENLFEVVKGRGRLSETEAISCFLQIGDALATMHEAGLVHRDAHPGNIILRDDGRPILIDFSIAKELVPATMSSTNKDGHSNFIPYEQRLRGSQEPNVDVYCLAATLYYVVTGKWPQSSYERKLENMALLD